MLFKVALLVCAIAHVQLVAVQAHSVLNGIGPTATWDAKSPPDALMAWSGADSTRGPCGAGTQTATAQLTVDEGSTVLLQWRVNAGDGVGTLSAKMDGAAGTDFQTDVALDVPNEPQQNRANFPFTFIAPAASECTGTLPGGETGVCNFQLRCAAWKSCVSIAVKKVPDPIPPPPPGPKCQVLPTLSYCSHLSGKLSIVGPGITDAMLLEQDAVVMNDAAYNLGIESIIRGGADQACKDAAKKYLCGAAFNGCAEEGVEKPNRNAMRVCKNTCTAFRNLCTIDATHLDTWPCSTNTDTDVDGVCPSDESVPAYVTRPTEGEVRSKEFIVGWKRPTGPEDQYAQMMKFVGDEITFDWKDTPDENVLQFPSKETYDACDTSEGSGAKVVAKPGSTSYKFLVTQPANSKLWFASSKPGSCQAGMKTELLVLAGGECTQSVTDACKGLGRQPCTPATGACGACLDGSSAALQSCLDVPYDYSAPGDLGAKGAAATMAPLLTALFAPLIAMLYRW